MTRRAKRKTVAAFRPGLAKACEAHLFEFTGRDLGCDDEQSIDIIEQVAGNSVEEGLVYLRRWRPNFEVRSVRWLGLITLVSGSPLD